MNPVAEEIMSYFGCSLDDEESLEHYGMPRRSGRYPWGSGENPYQRNADFLARVEILKKEGWEETPENIMKEFGLTTTQYRTQKGLAKDERRMLKVATAKSLKEDGLGPTEIARKMSEKFGESINESTVRSLLDSKSESRMLKAKETADFIKKNVDEKGMILLGTGVDVELNISKEKLNQALALLEIEGYHVLGGRVPQASNPSQMTTIKVIAPPDTPYKINSKGQKVSSAVYDYNNIHTLKEYISRDGGNTFEKKFNYPESMDSNRLMIRYKEDGGIDKDGIVELRPGVADLSLGESRYSQVRIMVDGNKYIKGMAIYGDPKDFPDGVDVIFNTNKSKSVSKMDVLKTIKDDPDNPFGSLIKDAEQGGQYWYDPKTGKRVSATDPNVKDKKLGLINKRADEGDWTEWKDKLPSQFLSKQSVELAKKQLNLAEADKVAEFDEICSFPNPTVKKHLLTKFADECDSAAVHLQAAALPGQKYHVIIPVNTLKDNEIYAPGYEDGTKLALIRYPHAGTFEIPILKVNNKNELARDIIGTSSIDAVGINKNNADRLSGADFDGDTVMCIPTHDRKGKVRITSTDELKGLKGFDPKDAYGPDEVKKDSNGKLHYYRNGVEYRTMSEAYKQQQMGVASNLITDMTLKGATPSEIERAVRYSMVVIDAEKHHLDYKQCELDNNISGLKKDYQNGGASTIISRSKSIEPVPKRQGSPLINYKGKKWYDPSKPEGALIWKTADDIYYPIKKYDKKNNEIVISTEDGKKIRYKADDKEAASKYEPIKNVDPGTGRVYFTNKNGDIIYKTKIRTQDSTKMAETNDARTLISDANNPMEVLYSDYANHMKSLANQARKETMSTGKIAYSKTAKEVYRKEVSDLNIKLNEALKNAPRERMANIKTAAEIDRKIKNIMDANPGMTRKEASKKLDIKKANQRALTKYRSELGAVARKDRSIKITDREWEAIQAGAVSETTLKKILNNTDIDDIKERAMPRSRTTLSPAKVNQIKAMRDSNYTIGEIAKKLGVSTSTVSAYLKGVN